MSTATVTLGDDDFSKYGKDGKWRGSVLLPGGRILGIPSNASRMVIYDPTEESVNPFGDDLGTDEDKWRGGILVKKRFVYATPTTQTHILKIDVQNGKTHKLKLPSRYRDIG